MILHQDESLFKQAITATAQFKQLPSIYIEKDYWICVALHSIFTSEEGNHAVFKGGTALSKCFNLIERFSEDIDMAILRTNDETPNQLKTKIKKLSNLVANKLPEIQQDGITNKLGMIRKTAHVYPKVFEGNYGQVRDLIILESSWLGSFEPFTKANVQSFVAEMMRNLGQNQLIEKHQLQAFEVRVLSVERTLCEKIMSLVRFSFTESPIDDLKNKIRHMYDLHQILQDEKVFLFFQSIDFETMLLKVAQDDVVSFKNNNVWLANHPSKAIIFSEPEVIWLQLRTTYNGVFKRLVYGQFPTEASLLATLILIKNRLSTVKGSINSNK